MPKCLIMKTQTGLVNLGHRAIAIVKELLNVQKLNSRKLCSRPFNLSLSLFTDAAWVEQNSKLWHWVCSS